MNYESILSNNPYLQNNESAPLTLILNDNEIVDWQKNRLIQLQKSGLPLDWATIGLLVDDPYFIIIRDLVKFPEGNINGYIRLYNRAYLEGGAAGVAMLPKNEKSILLIHHYRHATRAWHWEIPRGFGEPGISAEEQAKTELMEEIGIQNVQLIDLGILHNNTGLEGNPVNLFMAMIEGDIRLDRNSGIDDYHWFNISEVEHLIATEEITDGFTIAAFYRAQLRSLL